MVTAMRVVGDKDGEGGKAMVMATRVVGERTVMALKRAMTMKMKEACEEEGNGKGGKRNGDGE
jgi:hypothetical protein